MCGVEVEAEICSTCGRDSVVELASLPVCTEGQALLLQIGHAVTLGRSTTKTSTNVFTCTLHVCSFRGASHAHPHVQHTLRYLPTTLCSSHLTTTPLHTHLLPSPPLPPPSPLPLTSPTTSPPHTSTSPHRK